MTADTSQAGAGPERAATDGKEVPGSAPPLSPAAQRALEEAEERRKSLLPGPSTSRELGGREGPDPVRYGDWEKGGFASDF